LFTIQRTADHDHVGHRVHELDDIWDNAVEHTVWAQCEDCGEPFMLLSVEMLEDEDHTVEEDN
jgi:hypothetical protein